MSFLNKMNKPKPTVVGVNKPSAPTPGIKKPAPLNKPAGVSVPKPGGINKPNPLKKAVAPVKEVKIEEPQVEETNQEVVDELEGQEINLDIAPEETPVAVEEPTQEVVEEESVEEEKIEVKPIGSEKDDTSKCDVTHSEEEVEEIQEEEMSPQKKAAMTRKKNAEAKKKAESKKETSEAEVPKTMLNLPKVDVNRIEDYMYPVVLPTVETWEDEKEEVKELVGAIEIDPDMNSATGKMVLADLASVYSTTNSRFTHYKTQYENLVGKDGIVECVKAMYGQGKNAEERKFAATEACMNYCKPGEEEAVNLFEYEYMIRERYYFYEGVVKELEFKRQLLITFNGMLNIESRV